MRVTAVLYRKPDASTQQLHGAKTVGEYLRHPHELHGKISAYGDVVRARRHLAVLLLCQDGHT